MRTQCLGRNDDAGGLAGAAGCGGAAQGPGAGQSCVVPNPYRWERSIANTVAVTQYGWETQFLITP